MNGSVSLQIDASDDDGDTLSYSSSTLPDGLSIDAQSGLIGPTSTLTGTFAVIVTVSDGTDSVGVSFNWVVNTLPSVTNPGDQANEPGNTVNLQILASDDDNEPLSYSASGLPDGLTIGPQSGLISLTPTLAGTYAVTVTVSDGADSVSVNFNWVINTPPSVTNPGDQANEPGSNVMLQIDAIDDDGDTLSYSASIIHQRHRVCHLDQNLV